MGQGESGIFGARWQGDFWGRGGRWGDLRPVVEIPFGAVGRPEAERGPLGFARAGSSTADDRPFGRSCFAQDDKVIAAGPAYGLGLFVGGVAYRVAGED